MPATVLVAGLSLGAPALAEVDLTFGVGVRAATESNATLAPVSAGQTSSLGLDLSFGLVSETAASSLAVTATTGLSAASGPGNTDNGLKNPSLSLSYAQTTANADFTLDASLTTADLQGVRDVDDFETGSGTRRTIGLSTGLTWGKAAPLGYGLSAGITDVSYYNDPSPDLIASQTVKLGASLRADLSAVLRLDLALDGSRFSQPGAADRDTLGLDAGLALARPAGEMALHLITSDTPDGSRQTLRLDDSRDLAAGTLSWSLGATRGVTGTTRAIGSLDYAQDLPRGTISLGLDRTVGASALTDAETVQSSASLGYSQAVTARGNLALALNWAEQQDTGTDLSTANTSLAATWTQDLAQDWALDFGVTHRLRDPEGAGTGRSDSVFLELRRDFSLRY